MSRANRVAVGRQRPEGWQLCLAASPVVIALYYGLLELGGQWSALSVAVYSSANGCLAVCSMIAIRRHPGLRPMLILLTAAGLSSVMGDVIFYFSALVRGRASDPTAADFFYLALFPLVAGAFLVVIHRRTPGWDIASMIDASIVAISAAYLTYEFVIAPPLSEPPRAIESPCSPSPTPSEISC